MFIALSEAQTRAKGSNDGIGRPKALHIGAASRSLDISHEIGATAGQCGLAVRPGDRVFVHIRFPFN